MKKTIKLYISNTIKMKHTKLLFVLAAVGLMVLFSITLEIVSLSFNNILEVLTTIKATLFQLKIINSKGMILKPKILALNIKPLLLILFYLVTVCITFILTNWQLFLYIIVVYIFVKCLITNFYIKHFKFDGKFNINSITAVWKQRKLIAPFLIKLFLLMIPIRFIIRVCTLTLFNFQADILCIIILILLTLPFVYYFLNLIRKYLASRQLYARYIVYKFKYSKDQNHHLQYNKINQQDYFLFNDYVIQNINLYQITYIIFSVLFIKYCFYYYLAIIFLILIVLILLALYTPVSACSGGVCQANLVDRTPRSNNMNLQATSPPLLTLTWACLMDNLGAYLTWGDNLGYNASDQDLSCRGFNIKDQTNEFNQFVLRNVNPNHFNSDMNVKRGETATCYNWLHNGVATPNDGVWLTEQKDIKHAVIIAKSKILSMVYMQRFIVGCQEEFKRDVGTLYYQPQTLFKNDRFIGSVGRINKTLVVNFIRNDGQFIPKRNFGPSYYVHDESLRHLNQELEPVRQTIKFLEEKYGMYIPNRDSIENILTFTEVDKLRGEHPSLIKIMRPCPLFSDLYNMYETPANYFLCAKLDNWTDPRDMYIYNKIMTLKSNVQYHQKTEQNRYNSENLLNELYFDYLNIRFTVCNSDWVEGDQIFNSTRGHLFFNYKSNYFKNMLLFRQDDLDIFHFKQNTLIDMTWTRRRLLEKLEKDNQYSSFYVVSANRVSMELLSIERPYGEAPKIYSIMDTTNINTNTRLQTFKPIKHSFNILDKQDGDTLNKLLRYTF